MSPIKKITLALLGFVFAATPAFAPWDGDFSPSIAYNSDRNEFLSIYINVAGSGATTKLMGRRLDGNGATKSVFEIIPAGTTLSSWRLPQVLYNHSATKYVMFYPVYNAGTSEFYVQHLDGATGLPLGSPTLTGSGERAVMAYDASTNKYLVMYEGPSSGTITGQYLHDDLTLAGSSFTIATVNGAYFYYLDLASDNAGGFYGVLVDGQSANYDAYHFRLTPVTSLPLTLTSIGSGEGAIRIVRKGSKFWILSTNTNAPREIFLRELTPPASLGSRTTLIAGTAFYPAPALAYNASSDKFALAYSATSTSYPTWQALNSSGAVVGSSVTLETAATNVDVLGAAANTGCGNFVLGWGVPINGLLDAHFASVGPSCVPQVSVAPGSLSFTATTVGTSQTKVAAVATMLAPVTTTTTLSGSGATAFSLSNGCDGAPLSENETCAINVSFTPPSAGHFTASLTVSGGASPVVVALAGDGVAAAPSLWSIDLVKPASADANVNPQRALLIWKKASGFSGSYRVKVCTNANFTGCDAKAPNQGL